MKNDKIMALGEAAEYLHKATSTVQGWDRDGILKAHRTKTNRRYYYQSELDDFLGKAPDNPDRKVVIYARVSSRGQKDDLSRQIEYIQNFVNAKGIVPDSVISEIGSGLNYKRKKWLKLLKAVDNNEISKIYVTYKDRFVRFGFDFFEQFCNWHDCELIVLNNETTSPMQELVNDLVSIIHVFSSRIYGLRRYQSKIKELGGETNNDNKNSEISNLSK